MATYAIGDIQGCFDELQQLLLQLKFDSRNDQLWFCGDLVNRGPKSLETLRFVKALGDSAVTVLGNHDLHLLAKAGGFGKQLKQDTLDEIINAPDCDELMHWLRHQPLLHHDAELGYSMVHAGLPPQWDLATALACAEEMESKLRAPDYDEFIRVMYGNQPDQWSDELTGIERWRFITNVFTRLRFCSADGRLNLKAKGKPGTQKAGLLPWFDVPGRKTENDRIVFGHWSTL
ncbi:MAG TPA: symmetrical bis(5'-nucleosyl)-tetraphosphatase, partial [Candidatus Tenderia electrophaga]|nr:symmetrical bis(5'-nucleosyl)-tetraphosphatase [Candidatus Tenderia electrophaga]